MMEMETCSSTSMDEVEEVSENYGYSKNFDLYNVCIKNVSEENDVETLTAMFSTFGEICEVELIITNYGKARAMIRFAERESARKALLTKQLGDLQIVESWTQPKEDTYIPNNDNNFALDHLNDDCLYHLYSYIQLQDQLNLIKISQKQKRIMASYYRVKKVFDENKVNLDHITLYAIRNFLIQYGTSIDTINISKLFHAGYEFRNETFLLVIRNCNIRAMKLKGIGSYPSFIRVVRHSCPNLQKLELSGFALNLEEYLQFQNLETLILNCGTFQIKHSVKQKSENLKFLSVYCSTFFSEVELNRLAIFYPNLQRLQIVFSNIESITMLEEAFNNLQNLKRLAVNFIRPCIIPAFFTMLYKSNLCEKLEILEVLYDINEEHILIIGNMKNLTQLKINYKPILCENEIFWRVINKLVKRKLEMLNLFVSYRYTGFDATLNNYCLSLMDLLRENNLIRKNFVLRTYGVVKKLININHEKITNDSKTKI